MRELIIDLFAGQPQGRKSYGDKIRQEIAENPELDKLRGDK